MIVTVVKIYIELAQTMNSLAATLLCMRCIYPFKVFEKVTNKDCRNETAIYTSDTKFTMKQHGITTAIKLRAYVVCCFAAFEFLDFCFA